MPLWGLASAASLIATAALAAYIIARVPNPPTRLPFAFLAAAFAMWDLGEAVVRLAPSASPEALLPWIRFQWIGIAVTSGTFLHFALNFDTGRPLRERGWVLPAVYSVSAIVGVLVLGTDLIVEGVAVGPLRPRPDGWPACPPPAHQYQGWFVATIPILIRAVLPDRD